MNNDLFSTRIFIAHS